MKSLIAAFCAQMEDAIIIMRTVVQVSGHIHQNHVNVVVVIQDAKITAIRMLVLMFLNLVLNFGYFGKKSQKKSNKKVKQETFKNLVRHCDASSLCFNLRGNFLKYK